MIKDILFNNHFQYYKNFFINKRAQFSRFTDRNDEIYLILKIGFLKISCLLGESLCVIKKVNG